MSSEVLFLLVFFLQTSKDNSAAFQIYFFLQKKKEILKSKSNVGAVMRVHVPVSLLATFCGHNSKLYFICKVIFHSKA